MTKEIIIIIRHYDNISDNLYKKEDYLKAALSDVRFAKCDVDYELNKLDLLEIIQRDFKVDREKTVEQIKQLSKRHTYLKYIEMVLKEALEREDDTYDV